MGVRVDGQHIQEDWVMWDVNNDATRGMVSVAVAWHFISQRRLEYWVVITGMERHRRIYVCFAVDLMANETNHSTI